MSRKLKIGLFVAMVFIQLAVPFWMMLKRELILSKGEVYLFRTQAFDPNDPFRGKYIDLQFDTLLTDINDPMGSFEEGDQVYAMLGKDESGFAYVKSISTKKPKSTKAYVKAEVDYISDWQGKQVFLEYPFQRFYLDEDAAPEVERDYFESLRDSTSKTYAVLSLYVGEAVLQDVRTNGVSIRSHSKE